MTTRRKSRNLKATSNREQGYSNGPFGGFGLEHDVIHVMRFGIERQKLLLEVIKARDHGLAVNRKWCLQLKYDPDLRKLLKSGKLKRVREDNYSTRTTVLYTT